LPAQAQLGLRLVANFHTAIFTADLDRRSCVPSLQEDHDLFHPIKSADEEFERDAKEHKLLSGSMNA